MTKKHFKAIAKIINEATSGHPNEINKLELIDELINYFASINHNFMGSKFYHACFGKVKD